MINEMAKIQPDIQFDNHVKEFASNMKTFNTNNNNNNNNTATNNNSIMSKKPVPELTRKSTATSNTTTTTTSSSTTTKHLLQNETIKIMDCSNEASPIQRFYKDKAVFLTGASGFFGKIIIEKLLRDTDVGRIFLLIRAKKGKDVQTRLDEMFNEPVFQKLQMLKPNYRSKITVISGDASLPELDMSAEDRQLLCEQVNIIIHAAATVNFDEKLKLAIATNVRAIRDIMKLAKNIVNLKAFVHISTAFANCTKVNIEEKFYTQPISGENACKLCDYLDSDTLDAMTPVLLKDYPNTYAFTKALAEDIVEQNAGNLPITIFRPGVVIATYREPVSGWIDNMYGPCGVIVGVASGVMRVFCANMENDAQMVPVDMCVNALLASVWDIARTTYEKPPVYNFVPDSDNQTTWCEFMEYAIMYGRKLPMRKSIWFPRLTIVRTDLGFTLATFFYHTIPGLLMDILMVVIGKKPRMLKIYRKINKFSEVMKYFSTVAFTFETNNVRALSAKLEGRDKQLFAFDMRQIDWLELFRIILWGMRSYVVKDAPSTVRAAVKRNERLRILHYTTVYSVYALVVFLVYKLLKFVLF